MLGAADREIRVARALEPAEQHVVDGDRGLIAQQQEVIANLLAVGLDATFYSDMLASTVTCSFDLNKLKVYALYTRPSAPPRRRPKYARWRT